LSTIQPTIALEYVPKSSNKYKVSSSLLQSIRKYVGDGIQKRMDLIQEIWDLTQNATNIATRISHFKEYLKKDLENGEGFYNYVVGTFSTRISSLSDIHKREHNLPSNTRMKKISACWLKRITKLREMTSELDSLKNKRGRLFFKLVDLMKELDGPILLMDTMISSKETIIK
jgi:hypothetical protein